MAWGDSEMFLKVREDNPPALRMCKYCDLTHPPPLERVSFVRSTPSSILVLFQMNRQAMNTA